MNNNYSLKISLLLGTIIIFGIIVLVNNNNIYATQAIWRDFDNMKDFVSATSLNVTEGPETNSSQEVSPRSIDINVTVRKDPIARGENQVVTVVALNFTTGKELDQVFSGVEIKDPIGIIVKNYTGTEGNLTGTFKIGENAIGTFTISATALQAGVEIT